MNQDITSKPYRIPRQEVARVLIRVVMSKLWWLLFLAPISLIAIVNGGTLDKHSFPVLIGLFLLITLVGIPFYICWAINHEHLFSDIVVQYTLTDTGLSLDVADRGVQEIGWHEFKSFEELPDSFLLFLTPLRYVLLPKAAFEAEQIESIVQRIKTKLSL